jgi:hypothetical protein
LVNSSKNCSPKLNPHYFSPHYFVPSRTVRKLTALGSSLERKLILAFELETKEVELESQRGGNEDASIDGSEKLTHTLQ